jgi:ribosomal protein S18 acetylase RimI-like enzyme
LLAELGRRTFRDTFAADNTDSDMATYLDGAFGERIQSAELAHADSLFLIAHVDDVAVGYARLNLGPAPSCIPGTRPVEIRRLYSDASWIGRGVGAALMTACLDTAVAHARDVVWLDVWERNRRAIAFYRKWGFEVVGEADFVVGDDVQHDLLMSRAAG